jgi:hypothetical protein
VSTSNFVCIGIAISLALLAACSSTSAAMKIHGGCDIAPNTWRKIERPPERDMLLGLPDKTSNSRVGDRFIATGDQQELWFEDADRNFQACLYSSRESCYSGQLRKVIFFRHESSWEAEAVRQLICTD